MKTQNEFNKQYELTDESFNDWKEEIEPFYEVEKNDEVYQDELSKKENLGEDWRVSSGKVIPNERDPQALRPSDLGPYAQDEWLPQETLQRMKAYNERMEAGKAEMKKKPESFVENKTEVVEGDLDKIIGESVMPNSPYTGHCVAIDWLSLYVSVENMQDGKEYKIEPVDGGTQNYEHRANIKRGAKMIASLVYDPHKGFGQPHTGILKLQNDILYMENYCDTVRRLTQDLHIVINNISRLDVCADFQGFIGFNSIQDFIHSAITGVIKKTGQQHFHIEGTLGKHDSYSYLRFGSKTSDVQSYLYNKSLEMKQVKQKNYIVKNWVKSGFDLTKDVWRLEFSLMGNGLKILDTLTGQVKTKDISMLDRAEKVIEIFNMLYQKYWDFRIIGKNKKTEKMKKCNMLGKIVSRYSTISLAVSTNVKREYKRVIGGMMKIYSKFIDQFKMVNSDVLRGVKAMAEYCNLFGWFTDNFMQEINTTVSGNMEDQKFNGFKCEQLTLLL